jgi:cation transport ATPase
MLDRYDALIEALTEALRITATTPNLMSRTDLAAIHSLIQHAENKKRRRTSIADRVGDELTEALKPVVA